MRTSHPPDASHERPHEPSKAPSPTPWEPDAVRHGTQSVMSQQSHPHSYSDRDSQSHMQPSQSRGRERSSQNSVDSRQYDSRQTESRQHGSRTPDSRQYDSRQHDSRQLDPRQHESRQSESRQHDSRQLDPRQHDARKLDSRQQDSRQSGSRTPESRHYDSRQLDPRQRDSRQSGSRTPESRHHDSRILDSRQYESRTLDSRQHESRQLDSRQHSRSDSGATGCGHSSVDYSEPQQANSRRHDYDVQSMETSLTPRNHTKNPIPPPTVTVRSEFPTLNRSRQQQSLTCLVTVEVVDGKWRPDPEDIRSPPAIFPDSPDNISMPRTPDRPRLDIPREHPDVLARVAEQLRTKVDNWHGLDFPRCVNDKPRLA